MALEKRWALVPVQLLIGNGTSNGVVPVADSKLFRVKQQILVKSNTQTTKLLQVNRIQSPTEIEVGSMSETITHREDVSMFTVADGASVSAIEQVRPKIGVEDFARAVYDEEPAVAIRTVVVDPLGNRIDSVLGVDGKRRLATDANVSVTGISVDLDAVTPATRPDPDNVLIAGSEDGTKEGLKRAFVNNLRLQILATQDREAAYTYADFGTKHQRITRIEYTSATFPSATLRRDFAFTLVGNNYRRDTETWTVV